MAYKIGNPCGIGRRECPKTADYVRHLYYAWHTCQRIERKAKRWEEISTHADTMKYAALLLARTGVRVEA